MRPRASPTAPDPRPALLAVAALLLLLAPWLLLATGPVKLVGRPLRLAGDTPPVPATGPVERLELAIGPTALELRVALRRADVRAAPGEADLHVERFPHAPDGLPDLAALQAALRRVRSAAPNHRTIRVAVADEVPAGRVVAVLDAVRRDPRGPLLPDIRLESGP